jgi:hypothetical protein
MSRLVLGVACGVVYGALSAASMIPLSFPDKRAALMGAFINRFSIGCMIAAVAIPWPGWLSGRSYVERMFRRSRTELADCLRQLESET